MCRFFFYSRMLYCFILDLRKRKLIQDTRFTFYVSNHLSKSFIRTERYDVHKTPRWKNIYLEKWYICRKYFVFILIIRIHINHVVSILYLTLILPIKINLQNTCQYQLKEIRPLIILNLVHKVEVCTVVIEKISRWNIMFSWGV